MIQFLLLGITSYLVGSIPFGYIVAKVKGVDILAHGSGNIGATNALRVLGVGPGLLVFFLDVMKGLLPSVVAYQITQSREFSLVAGLCAMFGHSLSLFLKFKGGKGVSTAFGALLGSAPAVALSAFATFLAVVFVTRYVSLGSMLAAVALVVFGFLYSQPPLVQVVYGIMCFVVFYRHKANIKRLLSRSEPKFGAPKKARNQGVENLGMSERFSKVC
jgi:glycerol-3-phosphate acyltransferase PlsY